MIPLLLAVWRLSGGGALFAAGIFATAAALLYQHVDRQARRPLAYQHRLLHRKRIRLGHPRRLRDRRRFAAQNIARNRRPPIPGARTTVSPEK